jgi:hypothetical protein
MLFSQYFIFSLSISFHQCSLLIRLPLTLHNPPPPPVLSFPLSVSFHQCCILIHPSTTDALYCSSTSVFPVIIPPMLHTHSFIYHKCSSMFFRSTSVSPVSIIATLVCSFIHYQCCIFLAVHSVIKQHTHFPFYTGHNILPSISSGGSDGNKQIPPL